MATILPMSQESLDNRIQPPGYANHGSVATSASASRGAAAAYPTAAATAATTTTTTTASLSEVASAALADVGPSSAESDSSQNSRSRGGGGMQFVAGSSNGSLGGSQTDDTSPKSAQSVRKQREDAAGRLQRPYTPDRPVGGVQNAERSPQESESSRVKQGAKRTASGAVKGIGNGYSTADLGQNYVPRGHARTKSSTRAVEISNALKARLAYAMVKVRNSEANGAVLNKTDL